MIERVSTSRRLRCLTDMEVVSNNYVDHPQSVVLEIISPDGSRRTIGGAFSAYASRGLTLFTGEPIKLSTAISIEYEDVLFLGEVRNCLTEADGSFRLDIAVHHTLNGMQSLALLRQALVGEETSTSAKHVEIAAHSLACVNY
jgi:hypothetical protein